MDLNCINNAPYDVLSLYYDTPQLDYYFQKVEGEYQHIKVRRRCYSKMYDKEGAFLEVKLKANELIYKKRCLKNQLLASENIVNSIINFKRLIPTVQIYYHRSALNIKTKEDHYRITFDRNIIALSPDENIENLSLSKDSFIIPNKSFLLEIKSEKNQIPRWLLDLLKSVNANKTSFSKYANGMTLLKNRGK